MKNEHKVYCLIVKAVENGKLKEPFNTKDFRKACPGLGEGTYKAFLYKHRLGNPDKNTELFKRVSTGIFKLIRPLIYNCD
ncbi:MAG: hypothetical protein ACFFDN_30560 [Candidatus Hodarchaeota archaeon]